MKKFLFIICLAAIALGCTKSKLSPASQELIGKWEIRSTSGGLAGSTNTYPAGNGHVILFNADNTYKSYQKDSLTDEGTYEIIKNSINFAGELNDGIYFNHARPGTIIKLSGNSLLLDDPFPDGIASSYIKL